MVFSAWCISILEKYLYHIWDHAILHLGAHNITFGHTQYYIWAHAMRPYYWGDNVIVGANCIRPLLITSAAHQ